MEALNSKALAKATENCVGVILIAVGVDLVSKGDMESQVIGAVLILIGYCLFYFGVKLPT